MKSSLSRLQIAGFIFTGIGGVLLHYLYDWSGQNPFIALFSGINESTWEHMKLLFFPLFIFAILESFFLKKRFQEFWCVKLLGTLAGLLTIPTIFYTYNGAIGPSPDWLNIGIYYISAVVTFGLETFLFKYEWLGSRKSPLYLLLFCLLAACFMILTYFPLDLPLFADPLTQ